MNQLYYPLLNPIRMYESGYTQNAKYNSKHFDDYQFEDTILAHEQPTQYYQPWQKTDPIRLQLQSTYSPITAKLLDGNGVMVLSQNFTQVAQNEDDPTFFIYELDMDVSSVDSGKYQMQISAGTPVNLVLVSNYLNVCTALEKTVLLEYSHFEYHEGILFDTGFSPCLRIEGRISFKSPASKDTLYEDQILNETSLYGLPYRTYEFVIGDQWGVPDYLIDIINRVLTCSDKQIEGRYYEKAQENAKLEPKEELGYPARGWKIDMREQTNRNSKIYEDGSSVLSVSYILSIDSKGFGNNPAGTTYHIEDVD